MPSSKYQPMSYKHHHSVKWVQWTIYTSQKSPAHWIGATIFPPTVLRTRLTKQPTYTVVTLLLRHTTGKTTKARPWCPSPLYPKTVNNHLPTWSLAKLNSRYKRKNSMPQLSSIHSLPTEVTMKTVTHAHCYCIIKDKEHCVEHYVAVPSKSAHGTPHATGPATGEAKRVPCAVLK